MAEADNIGTALIRRHIGRRLEALRKQAGLTIKKAAAAVELSESTLIRMEDGTDTVRFKDLQVNHMLAVYEAPDDERAVLMALTAETRTTRTTSWWHNYTKTALPSWFGLYVTLEDSAEIISQYEPELIPGLLQTRAYAAQIMSVPKGMLDPEEAERRVEVRMARQALLTRARAPKVEVVLNEAAINRAIGMGPDLANEQLRHLLVITQKANVELRVVPWAAGVHGGMAAGGGFSLLRFPADPTSGEPIEPPLAYADSPTGALYLAEPAEVRTYTLIWADLISTGLDPEASRHLITTAMEGLTP